MCVVVLTETLDGVTVNVALRAPPGTKTSGGIVAAALSIVSGTFTPFCVASPSVSVPVEVLPMTTGDGLNVSDSTGGRGMCPETVSNTDGAHCLVARLRSNARAMKDAAWARSTVSSGQ